MLPLGYSFLKKIYCYSITVVCLFSPSLHPTPAELPSLPHLHPPPWFCPCVLYSSSCHPLSPLSPPHFPLAIVRLFLTSMSLVIFCLLFSSVDYVPVRGEIIWYLSLTVWLISLRACSYLLPGDITISWTLRRGKKSQVIRITGSQVPPLNFLICWVEV